MKIDLPKIPLLIINTLEECGFECFAVGGCIRDILSTREVSDWDFTTNATPDEIKECFSSYTTVDVGARFGTICVVIDNKNYEITTYRTDGEYGDSRHPDEVFFSKNLKDDLSRRDFTINALAYNDRAGLVDEFNGLMDLQYGVIRCIGDADTRFTEDALRIIRALRFASIYGYSIEQKTAESILKNKELLSNVSVERILKEFSKLICGDHVDFILRRYKDVIAVIIPEISVMFNFDQKSLHHNKDLWRHTVSAIKNSPADDIVRTALLFHDIGKPMTVSTDIEGRNHYKNHEKLSAAMANTILKRLKFPNTFIGKVLVLIEHHGDELSADKALIKTYLKDIGQEAFSNLLIMQTADVLAQSQYKREEKLSDLSTVEKQFNEIVSNNECYSLKDLEVNGKDLIHMFDLTGEQIGQTLNTLLNMVINSTVSNNKEQLLLVAQEILKEGQING
ncbi:MAG: HD domain-containing protein [Ruminococcaceae bacterium]|nr:HD domain-containing protein [Oscillospiraceae bacterium]